MIRKTVDPGNATGNSVSPTNKGKIAYYAHEQFQGETDAPLFDDIDRLSDDGYAFAKGFLQKLEVMVDRMR